MKRLILKNRMYRIGRQLCKVAGVSCRPLLFSSRMFSLTRVPVPVMGESITQGVLASWSVKVGDSVNIDDVVGSIETDKVNGMGKNIYK